jgi:formylglycine-generating enzyme required for sulfatase activity
VDWELVELLGVGGFGEVWKARNPHFDAVPPVALKFCTDPAARERLLRHEAAVLNQVLRQGRHPGIVALRQTYLSADPPCLEYEFVDGPDLAAVLRAWHHPQPAADLPDRAARLVRELAGIVAFAHRLNPAVVHRDLKPANVLLGGWVVGSLGGYQTDGTDRHTQPPIHPTTQRPMITDFGIGGAAAAQPQVTAARGAYTPLYAAPQQQRGDPPDVRDDVFALGVIWFQALTGDLAAGRPGGARWPARLRERGVPAAQVDLLAACLEEEPTDRPADAGVLAASLEKTLAPAAVVPAAPLPVREEPADRVINGVGMAFVRLPAGTFWMGSPANEPERGSDEGPRRKVTIRRPFYLAVHPVTQAQFLAVCGRNPAAFAPGRGGALTHPVEMVAWDEAGEFCQRLGERPEERQAGRTYRLPTEAEWEYACRAGTATAFAFGPGLASTQANFDGGRPGGGAARGPYLQRTTPIGSYPANAWGLYDMLGNVWEWCQDWYDPDYYRKGPPADPPGPERGDRRVVRGGAWNSHGKGCRCASRYGYRPEHRGNHLGFRVVLVTE